MKWMIYWLIAVAIAAHFAFRYMDLSQRHTESQMKFTVEMMKLKPTFIHPIEEK